LITILSRGILITILSRLRDIDHYIIEKCFLTNQFPRGGQVLGQSFCKKQRKNHF
jgi:hypothetical protein